MAQAQTKAAEHEVSQDLETLRSDLDGLRKDFGQLVSTLKGTASSRAEAELDALRKRFNKLADDVTSTGRQQLRSVESQIEERPLVSLAIAFALGLVVGRLLDRR